MGEPTKAEVFERLGVSFALDDLWKETMGLPPGDSKEGALRLVAGLLEREAVPYALIGGMAVQLHTQEPRTTRDIDLAVVSYTAIPTLALTQAGFEHTGRHAHSDNWLAPGPGSPKERTVVQFSADEPAMIGAVQRARLVDVAGMRLRLVTASDLVVLKLAAAEDRHRRSSKRQHDLGDILALIEDNPEIKTSVPALLERLETIRSRALVF